MTDRIRGEPVTISYEDLQELLHSELVQYGGFYGTLEDFRGLVASTPRAVTDLAGLYWINGIGINQTAATKQVFHQYQHLVSKGTLGVS